MQKTGLDSSGGWNDGMVELLYLSNTRGTHGNSPATPPLPPSPHAMDAMATRPCSPAPRACRPCCDHGYGASNGLSERDTPRMSNV